MRSFTESRANGPRGVRGFLVHRAGWIVGLSVMALMGLGSCFNSHVFDIVPECSVEEEAIDIAINPSERADILIVVDNSGSMCEEQANLAKNFYNDVVAECPLADPVQRQDPRYINPSDLVVNTELRDCGFIQILSAYENDFRVGVITTDVGMCDNRYRFADLTPVDTVLCDGDPKPGWGRRPQRGCLQAPPGAGQKFLTPETEDIGATFDAILDNVQTFGSSYERGLDAVKIFLDPTEQRHPDCADDASSFIRDDANLLVIFVTDEDDCSHPPSEQLPEENLPNSCEVEAETFEFTAAYPASLCYDATTPLTPVSDYVEFLRTLKGGGGVRMAVIGGALFDENTGATVAGNCIVDENGVPSAVCTPSFGNSNVQLENSMCYPPALAAQGKPPCCHADTGNRYFELAREMGSGNYFLDSICFESFRDTMRELAQFAGRVDFVTLDPPPPFPEAIVVEVRSEADAAPRRVERIPDGADTTGLSGWQLQDGDTVQFIGDALPQPGDAISVRVLRDGNSDGDTPCVGFSSSSNP